MRRHPEPGHSVSKSLFLLVAPALSLTFAQSAFILHIEQLQLTNFKNYEQQTITCSPHVNCFVGLNGMGKTNLLDAVYYLCMTRSHTGLTDANVVRHGADFFRLEAMIQKNEKRDKVVAKVVPRKKKEFEKNEVLYPRLADHIGAYPVVIIAPNDTNIILESSEVRRRFLDNTLSQLDPIYLYSLLSYNKILEQRNALLKQFAERRSFNQQLLATYDAQLLDPAQYLCDKRQDFVQSFCKILQKMYELISLHRESVDCRYESRLLETNYEQLLKENVEKDRALQRTTTGIHKDDLQLKINGYPARQFASQGQLKSLVLSLKLAQYDILRREKKMQPLLLLDDIFDKLDKTRVSQLLALLLEQSFGQIFITDTDEHRVTEIITHLNSPFLQFYIENGKVGKGEL
jgi:DNA replication and repair protein RecF